MLTIKNLGKILTINSQNAEVMKVEKTHGCYKIIFKHDQLNSELIYIIDRFAFNSKVYSGSLSVDGGKPHRYDIDLKWFENPFTFLKFLDEMTYDWDVTTNK